MSIHDTSLSQTPSDCLTILLAGGQGSRLHELTREESKPAVSFLRAGRIVDFVMASAARSGIDKMLVATQYRPISLTNHLSHVWGDKFRNGLNIRDGANAGQSGYLGTADAVRANLSEIDRHQRKYLLVLSGDHVLDMDFAALIASHRDSGAKATVAVTRVAIKDASSFGIFEVNAHGAVTGFAEKPMKSAALPTDPASALASMGIYVFDWDWLKDLLVNHPSSHDFGHDVLPVALAQETLRLHILPNRPDGLPGYWRDVGTLDAYLQTQLEFANVLQTPCRLPLHYPAINSGRIVGESSIAQRGAYVPPSCRLKNTIIAEGTVLPPGLVTGEDIAEDIRWFRRTAGGTVLITPEMAARWREDHPNLYALSA